MHGCTLKEGGMGGGGQSGKRWKSCEGDCAY